MFDLPEVKKNFILRNDFRNTKFHQNLKIRWGHFVKKLKNFCNSSQKIRKTSFQFILVIFNFSWFFYFVPNILFRIVG